MMTTDSLRSLLPSLLPHAMAVLAMFVVSAFLMAPAMLEDKRLRQGDIQNNIGMSKESRDLQAKDGEVPHWTDSMFGGMPTIQITGSDLNTAPKLVWKSIRAAMPMEVATLFVAMLSAYILGLCLGMSTWMALVLGLGFGLSSLNVLYLAAGHATKVRASPPCRVFSQERCWPSEANLGKVPEWPRCLRHCTSAPTTFR